MLEEKMTNCPKCNRPILNGGLFTSPAKFNMRCPWCQATLQINIQPKIITEVVKIANGNGSASQPSLIDSPAPAEFYSSSKPFANETSASAPEREITQKVKIMGKTYKFVGHIYPEE